MPIFKKYTYETTAQAIERADGKNINALKMVRNDISVNDWGAKKIKPANRDQSLPTNIQWPGQRDVGHTFRHVEATAADGKSVYKDSHTAIMVTMQILNSQQGQDALKTLQQESRALYDSTTHRVTALISGTWYGKSDKSGSEKRILEARCEIMKLGNQLWVHSSYPRKFFGSVSDLVNKFGG